MPYGHISPKQQTEEVIFNKEDEEEGGENDEDEREKDENGMDIEEERKSLNKSDSSSQLDFGGKTGFAAWFVSNCQTVSRRERLVEELQSYLPPGSIQVEEPYSTSLLTVKELQFCMPPDSIQVSDCKVHLHPHSQGCESRRQTFSSITRPTFREI
jgi:hypothetical protein